MRTTNSVIFYHLIRTLRTQAQLQVLVADIVLVRLIRHRPFVHAKAPKEPRLRGSIAEDFTGELHGRTTFFQESFDIYQHRFPALL